MSYRYRNWADPLLGKRLVVEVNRPGNHDPIKDGVFQGIFDYRGVPLRNLLEAAKSFRRISSRPFPPAALWPIALLCHIDENSLRSPSGFLCGYLRLLPT